MPDNSNNPTIGFPKEWKAFFNRHPSWEKTIKRLHHVLEKVFIREATVNSSADHIIFFMGRLCAEDFNEIFLLAVNGYGFGSLKILRGFFERVVTIIYISENKDEAKQFLEYHYIHRGKMLTHAERFFSDFKNIWTKMKF
jgi:hypothetical protein